MICLFPSSAENLISKSTSRVHQFNCTSIGVGLLSFNLILTNQCLRFLARVAPLFFAALFFNRIMNTEEQTHKFNPEKQHSQHAIKGGKKHQRDYNYRTAVQRRQPPCQSHHAPEHPQVSLQITDWKKNHLEADNH